MAEADPQIARHRTPRPQHVPDHLVRDIDMYAPEGIDRGYHEAWRALQRPDMPELVWTPFTGGHWIATRADLIKEIYTDPARFSSEVIFLPKEAGEKYLMVPTRMDPPEHTPYRKTLDKGLNLAQMRHVEDRVRQIAVELVEGLMAKGECEFSTEYARIFPVKVFMALCDLPMSDAPMLSRFAEDMTRPPGATPDEMAAALEAAQAGFDRYVEPIVDARRGGDGQDLITVMVNNDINGEPITRERAIGLISLLLLGGLDTVVNFLSFMMLHLARHPEIVDDLRSDPLVLQRSVEEMFRRFPVIAEARMVAHDQTYRGVELKRGDMILVPTAMHGLDESENADAMTLDIRRKRVAHSTFGAGPHRCAGMHLARMEAIITLQEWLRRIPEFHVTPGTSPIFRSGIIAAVDDVHFEWTPNAAAG
ncbi:MAG: cytochrome P450 [Sphingobium sp.]